VRGVTDDQTVPEPRPRSPASFTTVETALSINAPAGARSITVKSAVGFASGNEIAVVLDDGGPTSGILLTTVSGAPVNNVITLAAPLPWTAAAGNAVSNYTYQSPAQMAANYPAGH
jgi:hypothetical protein